VEHKIPVFSNALCEFGSGVIARYVIRDADTYYVIVTRQHRSEDGVAFTADVEVKVDLQDFKLLFI
jgi:hypothetical protein